jgi:hypothetical protein
VGARASRTWRLQRTLQGGRAGAAARARGGRSRGPDRPQPDRATGAGAGAGARGRPGGRTRSGDPSERSVRCAQAPRPGRRERVARGDHGAARRGVRGRAGGRRPARRAQGTCARVGGAARAPGHRPRPQAALSACAASPASIPAARGEQRRPLRREGVGDHRRHRDVARHRLLLRPRREPGLDRPRGSRCARRPRGRDRLRRRSRAAAALRRDARRARRGRSRDRRRLHGPARGGAALPPRGARRGARDRGSDCRPRRRDGAQVALADDRRPRPHRRHAGTGRRGRPGRPVCDGCRLRRSDGRRHGRRGGPRAMGRPARRRCGRLAATGVRARDAVGVPRCVARGRRRPLRDLRRHHRRDRHRATAARPLAGAPAAAHVLPLPGRGLRRRLRTPALRHPRITWLRAARDRGRAGRCRSRVRRQTARSRPERAARRARPRRRRDRLRRADEREPAGVRLGGGVGSARVACAACSRHSLPALRARLLRRGGRLRAHGRDDAGAPLQAAGDLGRRRAGGRRGRGGGGPDRSADVFATDPVRTAPRYLRASVAGPLVPGG